MAAVSCTSLKASPPRAGAARLCRGERGWRVAGSGRRWLCAGSRGGCWAPRARDGDELGTRRHGVPDTARGTGVRRGMGGLCAQGGAPACSWGHATRAVLALCCPGSVLCPKAYLRWREGDAPAVGQQAAALCSLRMPSLAWARLRTPVCTSTPAGSQMLLGRGKIKACPATGATGSVCVQGLKQAGLIFFPQSAASSPREVLHILGQVPRWWLWLLGGHQLPLSPGFGHAAGRFSSATPVPALLADAEHPPGLCWWLLSRAWCSAVPGSVACQPCGPRGGVGSGAEHSAVPTFASFVMAPVFLAAGCLGWRQSVSVCMCVHVCVCVAQ